MLTALSPPVVNAVTKSKTTAHWEATLLQINRLLSVLLVRKGDPAVLASSKVILRNARM